MVDGIKVVAIIQARMTSSRLPGKVMMSLLGRSVFENVVERVKMSEVVDEIWLATSTEKSDDILEAVAKTIKIKLFRGSLTDVLSRFSNIAELSESDVIVRITADNPLTEPRFITLGVKELIKNNYDYLAYSSVPYGSGVEVINAKSIIYANRNASLPYDREHVTPYIINSNSFICVQPICPIKSLICENISVTIDTPADFIKIFNSTTKYSNIKSVKLEDYVQL